jgi:energy-coupling factor transporter ATP-binding protein EcfA2
MKFHERRSHVRDVMTSESNNFRFGIDGIRIGDGDLLPLPGPGSVTAVVGANNVGKSTLLRQVEEILRSDHLTRSAAPRIVTEIQSPWGGTPGDFVAWLHANARIVEQPNGVHVSRAQQSYRLDHAIQRRNSGTPGILTPWFVKTQRPSQRIDICQSIPQLGSIGDPPTHPFHLLRLDQAARGRVKRLAEKIFGLHLYLDTLSGNLQYRIGDPGLERPYVDEVDVDYAQAVAKLPPLQEQGDGLRSTLGLLIPLITDKDPLTLIDEPEAFLHPPQARIVGNEIGKLVKGNASQIILATHDKNILQGLIESGAPVSIIHLTRSGDVAGAQLLNVADVEALWEDVTLRYGDALDGLFHSAVIVTESDRDSHFYAAAIDAEHTGKSPDSPAHNLMFLSSNGKQNMAQYVSRLNTLGVRTISCPDLDILNDPKKLQGLVEAHRGDWSQIEPDYKKATAEFAGVPKPPKVEQVKASIANIFADNADEELTERLAENITDAVKLPKTGWRQLKHYGFSAFKADKQAANRLLDALDALGIVAVRVGVLENFLTTRNAPKGPGWLPIAFEENAHKSDDAAKQARRLLKAACIADDSSESPAP